MAHISGVLNNGRILPVAPPTLRVATVSLEPDLARKSARHWCGRHGRLGIGRWELDGSTSVQWLSDCWPVGHGYIMMCVYIYILLLTIIIINYYYYYLIFIIYLFICRLLQSYNDSYIYINPVYIIQNDMLVLYRCVVTYAGKSFYWVYPISPYGCTVSSGSSCHARWGPQS